MLLILEIWLTVKAWRKGWRAWALLSLGIVMGVTFLIGAAVGASGGSIENAYPVALLVELAGIGALIGLATAEHRYGRRDSHRGMEELLDGFKRYRRGASDRAS